MEFPKGLLACTGILTADWSRRLHHYLHIALEGCIAGPAGVEGGGGPGKGRAGVHGGGG